MQRTLCMVKPDGVRRALIGEVIARLEKAGLRVATLRMCRLQEGDAQAFYSVHRGKGFYESLTRFMSSGPIVAMVLEGEEAIQRVRKIMGATNPREAAPGTIRADFAQEIEQNVVHGSDSPESAAIEIPFFFAELEILR
ncbi:MAG: nucleoside-diphosphate kinase [bacterium]